MPKSEVAYLVTDLLWDSRIRSTARARGTPATRVHGWSDLEPLLASGRIGLVLVDLEHPAGGEIVDQAGAIDAAGADLVVWGPHVAADLLARARAAGVGQVLTRGAFAQRLESILGALAGAGNGGENP